MVFFNNNIIDYFMNKLYIGPGIIFKIISSLVFSENKIFIFYFYIFFSHLFFLDFFVEMIH